MEQPTGIWRCYRYQGKRPTDAEARDNTVAVPPLQTVQWLKKPTSMRLLSTTHLDEVELWLAEQSDTYGPRLLNGTEEDILRMKEAVGYAMQRIKIGKPVVWGHWLTGGIYLALAIIPDWGTDGRN
ncbi:hypothetical protein AB0I28_33415 [Phytomonospora sp. NPDC050363]|uniref:hypothetical protein n=1 Tax=Phytomonospora sp. NPDC050363 TaxID=3155642 RepID=UPI0033CCE456